MNINAKCGPRIIQLRSDIVFEQVANSIELHYVLGSTLQPKLVEFNKEVAVEMMEVVDGWFSVADVVEVRLEGILLKQLARHVGQVDAHNGERISHRGGISL